jgi:large subunit ribosomal protein L10
MLRAEKKDFVSELESVCRDSSSVIFTHYHGLTVAQVSELRRTLRANGAKFKIVKNTLFKIAADNAKLEYSNDMISGPIAIAYSSDPVGAAKGVVEFAKKNASLKLIGGIVDNAVLSIDEINTLSKLPSLDELRGKIIGILQAPATKIAAILQAPAGQLARVINAYATK